MYIIWHTAGEVTDHKTSRTGPHTFPISAEDGGFIEFPRAHEAVRELAGKIRDPSESFLIALLAFGQHRLRGFQTSISKIITRFAHPTFCITDGQSVLTLPTHIWFIGVLEVNGEAIRANGCYKESLK